MHVDIILHSELEPWFEGKIGGGKPSDQPLKSFGRKQHIVFNYLPTYLSN